MTQRLPATASPDSDPSHLPEGARPRAPLVGVIAGVVVGLAWAAFCMATLEASLVLARRRGSASAAEEAPAPVEKTAVVQHVAQAAAQGASTQVTSPTG